MTDAYRSSGYVCPSCPGDAPLREYGTRLVCDACDGILLSVEDFAKQVPGREVRVIDDGGATRPCPRCLRPMRGCVIVVGKRHLHAPLVRCERDGIWFGDGLLTAVYEEIGSGGVHGSAGRGDGGFGRMYDGVVRAQEGRPTTLAHLPKRLPPREHSAPVPPSALRELRLVCPNRACGGRALRFEVSRWVCDQCDGLFVENAALEALAGEMVGQPWQLPPVTGGPGGRHCPACASALAVELLEGETVDRCAEHGVWFDPAELEAALQHAAGVEAQAGTGSWLRRLFFG
jgi:hypothetical protein